MKRHEPSENDALAKKRAKHAEYMRNRRANTSTAEKEKALEKSREKRRNLSDIEKEKQLQEKRDKRNNIPVEEKERQLQRRREKRASIPTEEKEKLLKERREKRLSISSEEREKQLQLRRQKRSTAPPEVKEREAQREQARDQIAERNRKAAYENNMSEEQRTIRSQKKVQSVRTQRETSKSNTSRKLHKLAQDCFSDESLVELHDCGPMTSECFDCGALHFETEKNNTKRVQGEDGVEARVKTYTKCCQNGKTQINPLRDYPEPFISLMKKTDDKGKNFMENIRSINASFAFASMGANISPPPGYGPYCHRIHGRIHHLTGTLHPAQGDQRRYSQLYILDGSEANDMRASHSANQGIDKTVFETIESFMRTENPFAQAYRMLYELEQQAQTDAEQNGIDPPQLLMAIIVDRSKDQRRYNPQVSNEVAVVFQTTDGLPPADRDLIIHCRANSSDPSKGIQRLKTINPNLEPMTYPLFFPYGDQGWGIDIQRNSTGVRKTVSIKEYLCYRLAQRRNMFNPLLNGGKLTQEYFVDAYVRMEGARLDYIRNNQETFRGSTLNGLRDYLAGDNDNSQPGQSYILPSSFQGGPRYMQQTYQDSMAIVTKYGKPDLFVTMTCNPKWKEIADNLEPWQSAENRPDLVSQVFELKLSQVLEDIIKPEGGIFGKVVAYVYVIEFQKRGLPHAHILLILDNDSKPNTTDKIDKIVNAEIPNKEDLPRLFAIVTSNMVHTPCGKSAQTSRKLPCMKGETCQKQFPKAFQETTTCGDDGYAKYKRRKTDKIKVGNAEIDNSWIVPYNPYLLLKFNCHINVEVCGSIKSVKYLYKYIFKGHDCASIEIKDKKNEIQTYVDTRYVSAPEAAWRIFGFNMHAQSHSVDRLPLHLPGNQFVVFRDPNPIDGAVQQHIENVVERAQDRNTMLTGYFELNKTSELARQLYYWQIPTQFTWLKDKRIWKIRERCFNKIGRMYALSPKAGDVFYLRLLLLHIKGATSYDQLLTVNGIVYPTFKEAAIARGLLLDDEVWKRTIEDAIACNMPPQLRNVFAYICVFGSPTNPAELWRENVQYFIQDVCQKRHRNVGDCRMCEDYALRDLRSVLHSLGSSLENVGLPNPANDLPEIENDIDYDYELLKADDMVASLNEEQRKAFDAIVEAANDTTLGKKCFFIDGPGGSGKTYLYTTLTHYFRAKGLCVLSTATTGIAANLLIDGRTMHSMFKLQIANHEGTKSNVTENTDLWNKLKTSTLIILDECTMASCHHINAIDKILKTIMKSSGGESVPFGGKLVLFGGDFRQCLSIIPHAARAAIIQGSLKACNAWRHFRRFSLATNMRCVDSMYSDWLLKLGSGTLANEFEEEIGEDMVEIPEYMLSSNLVQDIFGTSIAEGTVKGMAKMAILCPKNADVDKINEEVVKLINELATVYHSSDSLTDEEKSCDYTTEFLNSLALSGMPPHKLILKKGCVIMLLRNLNTKEGLCNGTRLEVTSLRAHLIEAEVLTGSATGNTVMIPRIDITNDELGFTVKRRQFPVKVAFAMTINKSQGQTLDKVGLFLREPVFGHGQLYVALSRVKNSKDIRVQVMETPDQGKLIKDSDKVFTRNVVYREVLGHH